MGSGQGPELSLEHAQLYNSDLLSLLHKEVLALAPFCG